MGLIFTIVMEEPNEVLGYEEEDCRPYIVAEEYYHDFTFVTNDELIIYVTHKSKNILDQLLVLYTQFNGNTEYTFSHEVVLNRVKLFKDCILILESI